MAKAKATDSNCHCRHMWGSHSKHRFGTVARKNGHGWCIICSKWCDLKDNPRIYKKLRI